MLFRSSTEEINNLKKQLSKKFAMKDLGATKQILGIRIIRDKANGTLKLSQAEYVKKILSKFNMNEAKPMSTSLGSHFRLSKEQSPKTKEERDHMRDSRDTCLCFTGVILKLQGYVDVDLVGDIDSRKSTTGFVFTLGGGAIS